MSSLPITPEQLAALPSEFQAILQAVIDHYEQRIARLEEELKGFRKTPQNSSLPPGSVHPGQAEGSANRVEEEAGWAVGASEVRAAAHFY